MPAGNPDIAKFAREGGRNSWKRTLTAAKLDAVLAPLVSPQDAKARLELIQRFVLQKLITPTQGNTAVRSVEIWLRAEAHEQDRQRMKVLEDQVARLEAELSRARAAALKAV